MTFPDFDFVEAAGVRRAVVSADDIRGDIAFQNDINVLLARLDARNPPLRALGWVREAVVAPRLLPSESILRVRHAGDARLPSWPLAGS